MSGIAALSLVILDLQKQQFGRPLLVPQLLEEKTPFMKLLIQKLLHQMSFSDA